jgi:phycocyanobilin lyase beta subunit
MTVASPLGPAIRAVEQASSAQELVRASRALAEALAAAGGGADQHGQAEAIGCLVQVLGFNNPGAAVAAVEGLIAVGSAAVLPLLDHLDPRNYGARAWAVRALAGIGDVRGLALLEEALATDVGPSVRRAAACGLGQLRLATLATAERQAIRARALAALLAGCSDGEWVVRYAVAVGLEKLMLAMEPLPSERDQARQALLALGQDQHQEVPVVRLRADLALRRLQQPDPVRSGRCA